MARERITDLVDALVKFIQFKEQGEKSLKKN